MFATRENNVIRMSNDIACAFAGSIKGYRVTLHALPAYEFHVEADSGDKAVALAVALCHKEGKALKTDAATFQRLV